MNHQSPPLITVSLDLSDEAAAKLTDFLLQIAHQMENHYSEQISRYHNRAPEAPAELVPVETGSGGTTRPVVRHRPAVLNRHRRRGPLEPESAVRHLSALLRSR